MVTPDLFKPLNAFEIADLDEGESTSLKLEALAGGDFVAAWANFDHGNRILAQEFGAAGVLAEIEVTGPNSGPIASGFALGTSGDGYVVGYFEIVGSGWGEIPDLLHGKTFGADGLAVDSFEIPTDTTYLDHAAEYTRLDFTDLESGNIFARWHTTVFHTGGPIDSWFEENYDSGQLLAPDGSPAGPRNGGAGGSGIIVGTGDGFAVANGQDFVIQDFFLSYAGSIVELNFFAEDGQHVRSYTLGRFRYDSDPLAGDITGAPWGRVGLTSANAFAAQPGGNSLVTWFVFDYEAGTYHLNATIFDPNGILVETINLAGSEIASLTGAALQVVALENGMFVVGGNTQGGFAVQAVLPGGDLAGDVQILRTDFAVTALTANADGVLALSGIDAEGDVHAVTFQGPDIAPLTGVDDADTIVGTPADDLIYGVDGNDKLYGAAGDDAVFGGNGSDLVYGGYGDDLVDGGAGNDRIVGNAGNDTASYDEAVGPVTVSLSNAGSQSTGGAGIDILIEVENLIGSDFADTLTGNVQGNVLDGGSGRDTLAGGFGDDTYRLADNDVVVEVAGAGIDVIEASFSYGLTPLALAEIENLVLVGPAALNGVGNARANRIEGNIWANVLVGDEGNDTLEGGAGNDVMDGGTGIDRLDGGADIDTVTYLNTAGAELYLDGSASNGLAALADMVVGVENVIGSLLGRDVLIGNAQANRLIGRGGDDDLRGRAGSDWLEGGNGADLLDGGDDIDTVSYRDSAGVSVFLDTTANNARGALGDTFLSVENLVGSLTGADLMIGNEGVNRLIGEGGNDDLIGRAGNDVLQGGAGNDTIRGGIGSDALTGGDGVDRFVFDVYLNVTGIDTITDFATDIDKLAINAKAFGGGLVAGGSVTLIHNTAPAPPGLAAGTFYHEIDTGLLSYTSVAGGLPTLFARLGAANVAALDIILT